MREKNETLWRDLDSWTLRCVDGDKAKDDKNNPKKNGQNRNEDVKKEQKKGVLD